MGKLGRDLQADDMTKHGLAVEETRELELTRPVALEAEQTHVLV